MSVPKKTKQPSEKQQLIAKIIRLQKTFTQKQQMPEADDALRGYYEEHEKLATRLVDLAHQERGTLR